jgi:hypothetical protein
MNELSISLTHSVTCCANTGTSVINITHSPCQTDMYCILFCSTNMLSMVFSHSRLPLYQQEHQQRDPQNPQHLSNWHVLLSFLFNKSKNTLSIAFLTLAYLCINKSTSSVIDRANSPCQIGMYCIFFCSIKHAVHCFSHSRLPRLPLYQQEHQQRD